MERTERSTVHTNQSYRIPSSLTMGEQLTHYQNLQYSQQQHATHHNSDRYPCPQPPPEHQQQAPSSRLPNSIDTAPTYWGSTIEPLSILSSMPQTSTNVPSWGLSSGNQTNTANNNNATMYSTEQFVGWDQVADPTLSSNIISSTVHGHVVATSTPSPESRVKMNHNIPTASHDITSLLPPVKVVLPTPSDVNYSIPATVPQLMVNERNSTNHYRCTPNDIPTTHPYYQQQQHINNNSGSSSCESHHNQDGQYQQVATHQQQSSLSSAVMPAHYTSDSIPTTKNHPYVMENNGHVDILSQFLSTSALLQDSRAITSNQVRQFLSEAEQLRSGQQHTSNILQPVRQTVEMIPVTYVSGRDPQYSSSGPLQVKVAASEWSDGSVEFNSVMHTKKSLLFPSPSSIEQPPSHALPHNAPSMMMINNHADPAQPNSGTKSNRKVSMFN